MIGSLLQPELVELIRQRNFNQLREILCGFPAPDLAEILGDLSADDKAVLLRILPHDLATEVFEYLSVEDQENLVQALGNEQVARILNEMPPDDRTALLEELPSAATQKLLNLLSPNERKIAADLLGYPKDSIGRRMTPEYIDIQQSWTVAEVFAHLRKVGRERESLNELYVVDEKGRLVDSVRLRNLVVAELSTPVGELLDHQVFALRATDDQETAVAAFRKYDRTILPVLDSRDVLVGVVTVDDVLDVADHPRHGRSGCDLAGLVEGLAPRVDGRCRPGCCSGDDRSGPDFSLAAQRDALHDSLSAGRSHGGLQSGRRCVVGKHRRVDASVPPSPPRI